MSRTTDALAGEVLPAERLKALVASLVRARHRQMAMRCLGRGLLASLCACIIVVVGLRLAASEVSLWSAVAALLLAGLLVSALVAWRRRPDPLEVVIAADVRLRLKQRLSTACEFILGGRDDELTGALARRACRARLPTRTDYIFPVEVDGPARAIPVAMIALVLVISLEMPTTEAPAALVVDERVAAEGVVLGEHGRRLEARARRGALTRAERQAQRMEQLGERMRSGLLSRGEALDRLRGLAADIDEERLAELDAGTQTEAPPLRVREMGESGGSAGIASLRGAMERALAGDGTLTEEERRGLESLGLDPGALAEALERMREGNRDGLEALRDQLADLERSVNESEALGEAGDAVGRARRNLGDDALAGAEPNPSESEAPQPFDGEGQVEGEAPDLPSDDFGEGEAGRGQRPGNSVPSDRFVQTPEATTRDNGSGATVTIVARGQLGEGEVYSSQVRVMPRLPDAVSERQAMASNFVAQAEAVMSEQGYPPHRKAFLRRYFLNLSEGANPVRSGEQ